MNYNALERLARQSLAREQEHTPTGTGTTLGAAEEQALGSSYWQTTARLDQSQSPRPTVVLADNPDMGGWF
jgi:hypothetical protein